METSPDSGVTSLTEDECWRRLETADVGRLAVVIAGEPEIFPINFVVDGHSLVFRTAEGTKLFGITASPRVALE
ncbi:MAG TPA: pyridoxamine 5'-phosphate oxidase family protein, partial [Kribbellaceae bacterium]